VGTVIHPGWRGVGSVECLPAGICNLALFDCKKSLQYLSFAVG
jgi:hypothetical protein